MFFVALFPILLLCKKCCGKCKECEYKYYSFFHGCMLLKIGITACKIVVYGVVVDVEIVV